MLSLIVRNWIWIYLFGIVVFGMLAIRAYRKLGPFRPLYNWTHAIVRSLLWPVTLLVEIAKSFA